jgi:hypothetical protein
MNTQQNNQTTHAYIEKRRRNRSFYGYLRVTQGGQAIYLGKYPTDSPTPLLDLSLRMAEKCNLYTLKKLLQANKSIRE